MESPSSGAIIYVVDGTGLGSWGLHDTELRIKWVSLMERSSGIRNRGLHNTELGNQWVSSMEGYDDRLSAL